MENVGDVINMETDKDDNEEGIVIENVGDVIDMETGVETDKDDEVNGLVRVEECEEQVQCDLNELDRIEDEKVKIFWENGCGCNLNKGRPCFDQFPEIHYRKMRNNCAELDHPSLDHVITGQIVAQIHTSELLEHRGKQLEKEQKHYRTHFYHLSKKVHKSIYKVTILYVGV